MGLGVMMIMTTSGVDENPMFPCSPAGELREYVCSELNVRDLETCSDLLK